MVMNVDFLRNLDYIEITKEKDNIIKVLNKNTQCKYKIHKNKLKYKSQADIVAVLNGREPIVMEGITRIVGYFSKILNWNKSKKGELKDRQKGNYEVK